MATAGVTVAVAATLGGIHAAGAAVAGLTLIGFYFLTQPKKVRPNVYAPSALTQTLFCPQTSNYAKIERDVLPARRSEGFKRILVLCCEEDALSMANGKKFFTGNHPVETLVPMMHVSDAGFTRFDIATPTGRAVCFEEWAFPRTDKNVMLFYSDTKAAFKNPLNINKIDLDSLEETYAAIFIPGGHGALLTLPSMPHVGKILKKAHGTKILTISLCHGPYVLLAAAACADPGSAEAGEQDEKFCYAGYKMCVFPDLLDKITPWFGYLPGGVVEKCEEKLREKGAEVVSGIALGKTCAHRELVTGDSPDAANALGVLAAEKLLEKFG